MTTLHREPGTVPGSAPLATAETCAGIVAAAERTDDEAAAALLMPYDGSPLTLDALERRAARRYTLAPPALRMHLARRALGLVEDGPPAPEPIPPPARRGPLGPKAERAADLMQEAATRERADGPPQLALW